jgi:hypothetical protein
MTIPVKPGPGRAVLSGDTKQRMTKEAAKRPSARGEAQGCADINAAQDVQALIAVGLKTHMNPTFAKKSNSPSGANPIPPQRGAHKPLAREGRNPN